MKSKVKFGVGEVGRCDANELTFAPWNPLTRIDATNRQFTILVDSIRSHGQLMPVITNQHGLVIEGNRRVAACRLLGLPTLYFVSENADAFLVYREVNNIRSNISRNQTAEIYAKDNRALTHQQTRVIDKLLDVFGDITTLNNYLSLGEGKFKGSIGKAQCLATFIKRTDRIDFPEDLDSLIEWSQKFQRASCLSRIPTSHIKADATYGVWLWGKILQMINFETRANNSWFAYELFVEFLHEIYSGRELDMVLSYKSLDAYEVKVITLVLSRSNK